MRPNAANRAITAGPTPAPPRPTAGRPSTSARISWSTGPSTTPITDCPRAADQPSSGLRWPGGSGRPRYFGRPARSMAPVAGSRKARPLSQTTPSSRRSGKMIRPANRSRPSGPSRPTRRARPASSRWWRRANARSRVRGGVDRRVAEPAAGDRGRVQAAPAQVVQRRPVGEQLRVIVADGQGEHVDAGRVGPAFRRVARVDRRGRGGVGRRGARPVRGRPAADARVEVGDGRQEVEAPRPGQPIEDVAVGAAAEAVEAGRAAEVDVERRRALAVERAAPAPGPAGPGQGDGGRDFVLDAGAEIGQDGLGDGRRGRVQAGHPTLLPIVCG